MPVRSRLADLVVWFGLRDRIRVLEPVAATHTETYLGGQGWLEFVRAEELFRRSEAGMDGVESRDVGASGTTPK